MSTPQRRPTFREVYELLRQKGSGRVESSLGTIYRIEARDGNIVASPRSSRVVVHENCWGKGTTCQGTWAGGIYNGPYSVYDWYKDNSKAVSE